MGLGRVAGLLLVALLTMPRARAENCGETEYLHEDRCCVFCPAGTFVANHCSASHSRGKCDSCNEGEGFTAHENGLEECLHCRHCKEGQMIVRPCTLTQNAQCQCKRGYFCADEGCEICRRHSQMHPDREEITPNCSDTTDSGCGLPSQGKRALVLVILMVFGLVLLLAFILKKLKCDKGTRTKVSDNC
ncbi:tumor necrosis factor receptor superfamily member 23-like isoform X2 [Corvus cornix cornix]|uniref:tumor necrosis factor receptor superfamily member 23-like isoform X2 n=1 Tax=Corvus cornix cornix TaxID=932674 RepID=UPI0009005D05|nr:tumor necrosis factor receptor superfamily member 23-like isoform X2 [Corvus cornix cornix]